MTDPRLNKLKRFLRNLRYSLSVIARIFGRNEGDRTCPCCKYQGRFETTGDPPRYGSLCPVCGSLERHRLIALADQKEDFFTGKEVLHFAPEPILSRMITLRAKKYITADLVPGRADLLLNIENINQPNESWDVIVCSHVLEHVNDRKAMSEICRILKRDGQFICMVPVIEGWSRTYENPQIKTEQERKKHFDQADHVRFYGSDFRDRLDAAGFHLHEYTAYGSEVVDFGLMKGEKVFLCTKIES